MSWLGTLEFVQQNWGNLASVAGLLVSIATLLVAQKAKEAADAARTAARRRSLAEDLNDAQKKAEQVGLFIRDSKWDIVFLRAQEISTACSLILSRWDDELDEPSTESMTIARDQASSIARVAMRAGVHALSEHQTRTMVLAQRRLSEILSAQHGASLKNIERS